MASFITTIQSKLGQPSQKALLLGAGFVTKPTVQILADAGVEVTVGQSVQDHFQRCPCWLTYSSLSNARECKETM